MHYSQLLLKSLVAILLLPLLVSACSNTNPSVVASSPATGITAPALQEPVARVNETVITQTELARAEKIILANKPGMQIPPLLQKEFEMQALNQLISSELLYQAGQKLVVKDIDTQVDASIAQVKSRFPDEKDYARELMNIGMDEKMLRDSTRRDLVIANFVNTKFASNATVSEEEIKKFYDQNPDKFRQDEQIKASHILVGIDSKMSAEEKKKAREKAERLHEELVKGADFAKLAMENSTCPSSKQGGDLGYFGKGNMVPSFEVAAFALKPGEVSGVVETQFGYHIIKLVDRKKAATISLPTAKEKIKDYLKAQKVNAAIADFVGEARKQAKVEILLK